MKKLVNQKEYKARLVDDMIDRYLKVFGAVCIEGPKWCGKTWTSSMHANSEFLVGDPSGNFSNRQLAEMAPNVVLEGETPRLIDEWQEVPSLWDATRSFVDKSGEKGQLILTGSSTPKEKGILHSGTGRIKSVRMNTMSLFESGDSSGEVSLKDICYGINTKTITNIDIELEYLAYLTVRGGWPGNISVDEENCNELAIGYMESVLKTNLKQLDEEIDYSEHKANLILKSLARNESTTVSNQSILRDIIENDSESISKNTLVKYLEAFNRMFILDNQEPFAPNIRSSLRVKQMDKRHFSDPAMACAMLKLTPKKLINDLNTFGFMFEGMVERDLRIYSQTFGGKLYHYQDYNNREIDAVIEMDDGEWCAIEIKLGANQIDDAAENLLNTKNAIIANKGKPPKTMCIICGLSNAAYKRSDGIYVVPISALRN